MAQVPIVAVAATASEYNLAEGIVWDDRAGRVRWVDVWRGGVLSAALRDGDLVDVERIDIGQTAGAVAPADDGGVLVAAARGLAVIAPGGSISYGPDLLGDRSGVRLNDGAVDPSGRFVVGTLPLGEETGDEVLLRVTPDGLVETLRSGVRLSNGVAFSPDGATIYHVDTLAGTVASHPYGTGAFDVETPWETVIDRFTALPDGLTVSDDGNLWTALFGGSVVQRHTESGEWLGNVSVDAAQVTCPAFIGPNLDVLAITSAQEGLDGWLDRSGAIFLAQPGARGLPVSRWAGSTVTPYWMTERAGQI